MSPLFLAVLPGVAGVVASLLLPEPLANGVRTGSLAAIVVAITGAVLDRRIIASTAPRSAVLLAGVSVLRLVLVLVMAAAIILAGGDRVPSALVALAFALALGVVAEAVSSYHLCRTHHG